MERSRLVSFDPRGLVRSEPTGRERTSCRIRGARDRCLQAPFEVLRIKLCYGSTAGLDHWSAALRGTEHREPRSAGLRKARHQEPLAAASCPGMPSGAQVWRSGPGPVIDDQEPRQRHASAGNSRRRCSHPPGQRSEARVRLRCRGTPGGRRVRPTVAASPLLGMPHIIGECGPKASGARLTLARGGLYHWHNDLGHASAKAPSPDRSGDLSPAASARRREF